MTRRTQRLSISLATLALLVAWQYWHTSADTTTQYESTKTKGATSNVTTTARVARVVDGDTVELDSGEKVRYIGMNTPESVDPRKTVECFGKEASKFNKELVEGKRVRLVADVGAKDRYGRLLRYVYLDDGTFVNLKLVEDGYASVMTVPPNVQFKDDFLSAQKKAREGNMGLWSACR